MKNYATASIPKYLLYTFSLIRLEEICLENQVALKAIRYAENQVICKLYGSQEDIKAAIKNLYSEINEDCKKHSHTIKKASKIIPSDLREYEITLSDDEKYQKNFARQADKYMKHCALNDINPHPEVFEDYVFE